MIQPIIEAGPYTLRPPGGDRHPVGVRRLPGPGDRSLDAAPRPFRAEHAVDFVENGGGDPWPYVITRTETGELLGAIGVRSFDGQAARQAHYWLAPDARGGTLTTALSWPRARRRRTPWRLRGFQHRRRQRARRRWPAGVATS